MTITDALLAVRTPVHASIGVTGRVAVTTERIEPGADAATTTLAVIDIAGSDELAVPPAWSPPGAQRAVWAPDGAGAAWMATTVDGRTELQWSRSLDGPTHGVPGSTGVVGPPAWSPDGRRLAFVAPVDEPASRTAPLRWTRPILAADSIGPLDAPPQLHVADLSEGTVRRITHDQWRWSAPQWSPDGRSVSASAAADPTGRLAGQHLSVFDLDGTAFTPELPRGRVHVGAWLPDGRLAVLVVNRYDRLMGSVASLYVVDRREVHEVEIRDVRLGGDVYGDHSAAMCEVYDRVLLAAPDGSLVARTFDRGAMGLARLTLVDGEPGRIRVDARLLVDGDRCCTPVGVTGSSVVFATVSASSVAELAVVGLDGQDERQLTRFGIEGPTLVAPRRLAIDTDAPGPVDAWFFVSPGATEPAPTVLMIHGGPNYAFGDTLSLDVQALCARGFAVLYANPRGSTGVSDEFAHAATGDWADGPSRDVLAALDEAVDRGWVDPRRVAVNGNSYGGYLSAWLVATTDRFRAAVIENPVTDLMSMHGTSDIGPWFLESEMGGSPIDELERYVAQSPLWRASACTTPTLWVLSGDDRRCPNAQGLAMHRALCAAGTTSELLVLPGIGHEGMTYGPPVIRRAHDEALVDWIERWLPDADARAAAAQPMSASSRTE